MSSNGWSKNWPGYAAFADRRPTGPSGLNTWALYDSTSIRHFSKLSLSLCQQLRRILKARAQRPVIRALGLLSSVP